MPRPVPPSPLDEFKRLTVGHFEEGLNRVAQCFREVLAEEGLECEDMGLVSTPGLAFRIIMIPDHTLSFCLYKPDGNTTYIAVQGLGREPGDVALSLVQKVGEHLAARG
jgi:hypothetical protein